MEREPEQTDDLEKRIHGGKVSFDFWYEAVGQARSGLLAEGLLDVDTAAAVDAFAGHFKGDTQAS